MMDLALSVRIAEGFLSKEHPILSLEGVAEIATAAGYSALCLRASQIGVSSTAGQVAEAAQVMQRHALGVSMVTGDFDIVYNNDRGPSCLRQIEPYLQLAKQLGAPLIRVALRCPDDIASAQRAADAAAEQGVKLVHQCHTQSLFETVEQIESTLRQIDRPNFGIIYEPANLELCGQDYGSRTVARLAPWIFNVYLQNQRISDDGDVTLDTWCRGKARFNIIPIHASGGIDFPRVVAALRDIGYAGRITVHQSAADDTTPQKSALDTAEYLRGLIQ